MTEYAFEQLKRNQEVWWLCEDRTSKYNNRWIKRRVARNDFLLVRKIVLGSTMNFGTQVVTNRNELRLINI